ncbi:hypothetical protein Pcinc_011953 [Petrolisthes cinctipes]|uniref:Uncharacterized protein n=1 Tax=Petrolisthes cinctipes TaxID=88211 RepID=A0AAE1G0B1_PETCI|nr:hypothetical protein Pcinc_011953 [Petrolisthes cinctipes]
MKWEEVERMKWEEVERMGVGERGGKKEVKEVMGEGKKEVKEVMGGGEERSEGGDGGGEKKGVGKRERIDEGGGKGGRGWSRRKEE